ncbi:putative oxidoreductase, 2OG-Fe(II) oxygenase family [Aspergillus fischeri NRRL 181]|uniref:Oxidoreductase, 2OG-Fe(II) oxygenase family, putative n=1 Tax=Neosartorya fischeri (strain ATCC 1020 / DSM 3700 / CBS 544.65 / FGSC A1164 / JCM 1740 / NRRL 181 / WB 181) TaxID=331117 RepID=A1DDW9_NEOFI|nr:oxidoreductase, 2OG-Fe(II) oxygenase family, putative [Aspergillus fischeri NRRL 181]EAW17576.1 oxidoreductase, 2OG-Fe(II) oxygenase family, putative [Aspergillus fischeri NRRL 181]
MEQTSAVGPPIELPIIDISNPDDPNVGKAMLDAAAKYGFLYVDSKGTDFAAGDVNRAFELSKAFFASPAEEKATCRITPNNRGWSGMHIETLDPEHQRPQITILLRLVLTRNYRAMNFGEFKDGKAQQPLPPSLAAHEAEIGHFASLCNKTCNRILKLLALGLQIPNDFFTSRHDPRNGPTGCILRYLYYPSIFSPATSSYQHDVDVRAGAHSDYGSITLLFQRPGQPGLEIRTPDGSWAPVPVQPGNAEDASVYPFPPILVNIGDLLSYWTDSLLKSTIHRVVFPLSEQRSPNPQDRYSIAYFCHPVDTTELVPVPSEAVVAHREYCRKNGITNEQVGFGGGAGNMAPGKRALTAYEHLESRLAATYGFKKG